MDENKINLFDIYIYLSLIIIGFYGACLFLFILKSW